MLTLLMTRPQRAAERFVASLPPDLRSRLDPLYSPLVGIEPVSCDIEFGNARGLIFTSANGVSVTSRLVHQRDLPCYCVGKATTKAAQLAGWRAECAGKNAEALINSLQISRPPGPLLHLRGRHSRGNVAEHLTALGVRTQELVVYDQPLLPLSDAATDALSAANPIVVPLFSPRTARQFGKLCFGQAPLYIAALSDAVANQIKLLKYNSLKISTFPNSENMAHLAGQLTDEAERVESARPSQ